VKASVPFKVKGCPQPVDLISVYSKKVHRVSEDNVKLMLPSARELIAEKGAEEALAAALFAASGLKDSAGMSRSLLTGQDCYVTISVQTSQPIQSLTFVWNVLPRYVDANTCAEIKGIRMREDGMCSAPNTTRSAARRSSPCVLSSATCRSSPRVISLSLLNAAWQNRGSVWNALPYLNECGAAAVVANDTIADYAFIDELLKVTEGIALIEHGPDRSIVFAFRFIHPPGYGGFLECEREVS
jgi:hypothetical protein